MKPKKHKVRFHLQHGENFRKWQIRYADGRVEYHDPETTTIIMHHCKLINRKKIAEKIYGGQHKDVCAWVECESVKISKPLSDKKSYDNPVLYNPRIVPNWVHNDNDVDGKIYGVLMTEGRIIHSMTPKFP
jgi:hypothetical protein